MIEAQREALNDLRARARAFATGWVEEHGSHDDCWMTGHSREAAVAVGQQGWIGMAWPTEVGGGAYSPLERLVVMEELIQNGVPIADWWFADQTIGAVLVKHGTASQQQQWLPGLISGQTSWTLASAEPLAGSDPKSMTTTALVDGDEVEINGTKMWVLWPADWCYLVCRTETSTRSVDEFAVSEFIVDLTSPSLTFEPIKDATGRCDFGYLHFDRVRIPLRNRIGSGRGRIRLLEELDAERGGIDRLVSNRAMYLQAVDRINPDDAITRAELLELEQAFRVGRLMVLKSSTEPPYPGYSAIVKIFCAEFSQRAADFAARVTGAEGLYETRFTRSLLYSTAYTIMGGTSEVLRTMLADRVLDLASK